MTAEDPNPYEPSASVADLKSRRPQLQGFARGFRNGTFWSLLLTIPVSIFFFNYPYRPSSGTIEVVFRLINSVGIALTYITLPWALSAGAVEHALRKRRQRTSRDRDR